MRQFKNGTEIRLGRDDLHQILTEAINDMFSVFVDEHEIVEMALHPSNKYVVTMTLKPAIKEEKK